MHGDANYFSIGTIVNAHGTAGCVRVYPATFDVSRFSMLDKVILRQNRKEQILEITDVRYHKNLVILKFSGVDNMDDALALKSSVIIIPRENALPLEKDEYYIPDLIGMAVFSDSGEFLGELTDCLQYSANDVYVISKQGFADLLLPAIKQCIISVDIENKKMIAHVLEGLR